MYNVAAEVSVSALRFFNWKPYSGASTFTLHLAVLPFCDCAVIVASPPSSAVTTALCVLLPGLTDTILGLEEVQVIVLSSVVSAGSIFTDNVAAALKPDDGRFSTASGL